MTIKITITTPELLPRPPKPTIYFLNFIMTTLCSPCIIIIVHKNNYYCNSFIIFIMYVLSGITIVYIIYTHHIIKLLLYSCPNLFSTYDTNIVQYSIEYYYTIYPSSSSCRAASTDIADPISPFLPIVRRLCQVFRATPRILT